MKRNPWLSLKGGAVAGMIVLGAALLSGCSVLGTGAQQNNGSQEKTVKTVKVQEISKQKIGNPVETVGEVESSVQMKVNVKAGGDVLQILKKRGEAVKAGEAILRLDSKDLKFKREKALADLQNVQDAMSRSTREAASTVSKMNRDLAETKRSLNKAKNDYDLGSISIEEVDLAQTAVNNAQSELDLFRQQQKSVLTASETEIGNAQLALKEADLALTDLEIKAPVSGILTVMPVETGMTLPDGAEAGVIENLISVNIKAHLSAEAAKFASGKKQLTFYSADESQKSAAEVAFLGDVIDPDTKSYELVLKVPNRDMNLKPGMKVRIQLTDENEQYAIAVPTQSIIQEGEESYVFVLSGDQAEKRRVQLGRLNEPLQEVLTGVKEGETVVISGHRQLKDKEKVRAQRVPAKAQKQ